MSDTKVTLLAYFYFTGGMCTARLIHRKILYRDQVLNPLNTKLLPICHLLALLGAHHILHVSRIRVKHRHNEKM